MSASSGRAASTSALGRSRSSRRAPMLKRLHNQPGVVDYKTEILGRGASREDAARSSGPRWSAAAICPLDGHVNSLRLFAPCTGARHRGRRLPAEPPCREHRPPRRRVPADDGQGRDPRGQGRAGGRQRQHAAGADGRARGADAARSAGRSSSPSGCGRFCTIPSPPCARPTKAP